MRNNIIFLVHDIHFVGGGERVTVNMANHFAAKGDNVSIISITVPKPENVFNISEQVEIEYLNIKQDKGVNLCRKIRSIVSVRRYFKNTFQQTFLLGMGTYPSILIALIPSKDQLIKIGCQHGSYSSVKYFWFVLRWILFRRLNTIVSLTNHDLQRFQKLNKNVHVIPNSISFSPDQPADLKNKTILSIGRMDYPKGYDLLLKVFSRFCIQNKEWKLRIIGDGPMRNKIKKIIDLKGLSERISILPVSNEIIKEYMNASLFILTSRSEGFPMVLLEAQACGLPVLAFNCETGPSEIINNGEDGYLIDNYNIDEMSNKLMDLCLNAEKRIEFGRRARQNVKKFLPDQIFNKWETLFNQLQTEVKY